MFVWSRRDKQQTLQFTHTLCSSTDTAHTHTQLTDGDAAVRAHQVDVGLGDGRHADLVVGSGEEGSERAGERHRAVTCSAANGDAHLQQRSKERESLRVDLHRPLLQAFHEAVNVKEQVVTPSPAWPSPIHPSGYFKEGRNLAVTFLATLQFSSGLRLSSSKA